MYKTILATLIVVIASLSLTSQITIDNSTLPEIGDVLTYRSFSDYPDTISFRNDGENLTWTFDNFVLGDTLEEAYKDISLNPELDSLFPQANMIWDDGDIESAGIRTENNIEIIGIQDIGIPFGGQESVSLSYDLRTTPLNYGDTYTTSFSVPVTIGADLIPGLDSLDTGIPGASLDSLRITLNNRIENTVTAWGTLNLEGVSHDVLKLEQRDSSMVDIEIGLNVFGVTLWLNLNDIIGGTGGGDIPGAGDLGDFDFGDMGGLTYQFLSNDTKYSLVEFNVNEVLDTNGVVTNVVVNGRLGESLGRVSNDNVSALHKPIQLYPNPTSTQFWLDTDSSAQLAAEIKIFNSEGQCIMTKRNHPLQDPIDVSALDQGYYFMIGEIEDKIVTSKISVMR